MEWSKQTIHRLFTSKRSLVNQNRHVSPVLLRYLLKWEGLSNKQAADAIGITPETVRRGKIDEGGKGHRAFPLPLLMQLFDAAHPGWLDDLAKDKEAYEFAYAHAGWTLGAMLSRAWTGRMSLAAGVGWSAPARPSLLDTGGLV